MEKPRRAEGLGQVPSQPQGHWGGSLDGSASLARGFSCSQGPSQELLDAGHTVWTREWDPGMQGAPGGFRDGGKEALNAGFQRGEGSQPGCKSQGCLACLKGRGCSSCLLMHSWVNTGVEKKELSQRTRELLQCLGMFRLETHGLIFQIL